YDDDLVDEPEWQLSYGSYGNSQLDSRAPLTEPACPL
ncbi:uncharacterized, partial [Tachysurus ichikawai]